ncbi:MAG: two-partner secretion domain-containing protein, partial [Planctomycetota bacterium]
MELFTKLSKTCAFKRVVVYFLTYCMIFHVSLPVALAGPEGAQVVNGQVSIQQSGNNTVITASDKSIVNYSSFDIAQPEVVRFIQPGSDASVLNRILSANPTNIYGTLLANGRVFFVNPAGVYIGSGATINVNQLVASALDISNSDFINGRYDFVGGNGSVINSGDISAESVYLIGKQVANSGSISCPAGYVVMASGDRVFLGEPGSDVVVEVNPLVSPEPVDPIDTAPAVLNEGTVEASGGMIVLAAAGDIYSQAISNVGTLSASVDTGQAGEVKLTAAGGEIVNSGTIEASGDNGGNVTIDGKDVVLAQEGLIRADSISDGAGGSVEVCAGTLVAEGLITAGGTEGAYGHILLDPDTYTITSTEAGNIVTALGDGSNYTISAAEEITQEADAAIDTTGQSTSTTLSLLDENTDDNLTINLNAPITLADTQTLTGQGTVVNVAATGSVQNGIDVASPTTTATIEVSAGSYTEDLSIDKSVVLNGAQWDTPVPGSSRDRTDDTSESIITGEHTIIGSGGVTGVTIDGFTLSDPDSGSINELVQLDSSGGEIDTVTLRNNFLVLGSGDIGVDFGGYSPDNELIKNVTIEGSKFIGPDDKISNPMRIGANFGTDFDVPIGDAGVEESGVTFRGNIVEKGSIPIQLQGDDVAWITITENTFTDTDGTLYVWGNAAPAPTGVLSNFEYSSNHVDSSNTYGVGIGVGNAFGDGNLDFGTIKINNNTFGLLTGGYGIGAVGVFGVGLTGSIDATANWWGHESGPGPTGSGSAVSGSVDFSPWLAIGDDAEPGIPGFQPESPMTWSMIPSVAASDFAEWIGLAGADDTLDLDYTADATMPAIDDGGKGV